MVQKKLIVLIACTTLTITACGGGEPQPGQPQPTPEVSRKASITGWCATICSRRDRCGKLGDDSCRARCQRLGAVAKPQMLASAARCALGNTCGKDCLVSALADVEGTVASVEMFSCLSARLRCTRDEGVIISDSQCTTLAMLETEAQPAALGCLTKPCAQISACLQGAGAVSLDR